MNDKRTTLRWENHTFPKEYGTHLNPSFGIGSLLFVSSKGTWVSVHNSHSCFVLASWPLGFTLATTCALKRGIFTRAARSLCCLVLTTRIPTGTNLRWQKCCQRLFRLKFAPLHCKNTSRPWSNKFDLWELLLSNSRSSGFGECCFLLQRPWSSRLFRLAALLSAFSGDSKNSQTVIVADCMSVVCPAWCHSATLTTAP